MVTYSKSEGELVEFHLISRRMSSKCTNTTIDIQDTLDKDGGIEKGSDGGRTTDDGGCVSDRE